MQQIDYKRYSEEKRNLYFRCKTLGLNYEEEHQKLIEKYFKKEGKQNG